MSIFFRKYKRYLKWALLILVLALIGQFIRNTDLSQIGTYLKQMPLTFLGILLMSFLAYLCATIAWRLCLGPDGKKTGLYQLFMIRHVGEVLSVFNPTSVIAGETLKAHYLRKQNISDERSISSILMSRILIILSAILLLLLSSIYLMVKIYGADKNLVFVLIAAATVGLFGYLLARFLLHSKLYFARFIKSLQGIFGKRFLSDELHHQIENINRTAYTFYIHNRGKFYLGFILSIIHWIFGAAEFYLILLTLGFHGSLFNAIAIEMGVILFKTVGAIVPGQIGVEEYANKIMLGLIGIASNEVWLVVSILRRARQLFWVGVAGVFYWLIARFSPNQVIQ